MKRRWKKRRIPVKRVTIHESRSGVVPRVNIRLEKEQVTRCPHIKLCPGRAEFTRVTPATENFRLFARFMCEGVTF